MKEFRAKQKRGIREITALVAKLEDQLAAALARAVAAESILAASRVSREVARETRRVA